MMVMEIQNCGGIYENTYMAQKQQAAKKEDVKETSETKAKTTTKSSSEKIESAKDGKVLLDNEDTNTIIEAAKEDNWGKMDTRKSVATGTNFDIQI